MRALMPFVIIAFPLIVHAQAPPPLLARPPETHLTPVGRYKKLVQDAIDSRVRWDWYTYVAKKADLVSRGSVRVSFWVDRSGKPKNLRVVENTLTQAFASSCLQSILEVKLPPIPEDVASLLPPNGLEEKITFKFGSDPIQQRPPTVPATAFWLGRRELSGVWIDVRSVESNAFTADVYFESGKMWMSDRFVVPPNRLAAPLTDKWLREHIIATPDDTDITVINDGEEIVFHGTKGPVPAPSP